MTKFVVFLAVMSLALSGCYINKEIKPNEVGVKMERNVIQSCQSAGVESDWGFWSDLEIVSMDTLTFKVSDPEVATADNQLVGIEITIQARRKSDCDSVKSLLTNWSTLKNDENLTGVITATALEGIKVGTRQFRLEELLNDRNGLSGKITEGIEADAGKYSTEIINVTVSNIALDPNYANTMQEKALLTAQIDLELRRQDLIRQTAQNDKLEQDQRATVLVQKLLAEQAQTAVDVEIASREGKKIAEQYSVYSLNPQAFELERWNRIANVFDGQTVYFIPSGSDLNLLFGNGQIVPLQ